MTRARDLSNRASDFVSVKDFGAVGDGVTNDGPAFRAAILYIATAGGGTVIAPYATYKISTTVVIPSNVTLDLQNSIIEGPGIGSLTDVFQSGYYSSGSVITNIGTANESHVVTHSAIKNATINNCGIAINVFNWIWICEISNVIFNNCTYAIYSSRSWYSRYTNLISRGSASSALNAAYYFDQYTNVEAIESVFASDRAGFGFHFNAGANGLKLLNCSVEGGNNGVYVTGETGPMYFDTCYFEDLTGTGIDFDNTGYKYQITVDNCFFNNVVTGVKAPTSGGSLIYISENNRFIGGTTKVNFSDNYYNYGAVKILPTAISDNGTPALPSGYTFGGKSRVDHDNIIFDSSSGLGLIRTKVYGTTLIPFNHEGNAGSPKSNTVPFCTVSKSAGTTFDLYVDTKITYSQYGAFLVYRFTVTDNVATYQLYGQIFGDSVKVADSTGKTVTVSNNGGYVRITLSSFTHPSSIYGCTGIVRHM